jgi:sigma-E factor negative regulatory protein RseC
MKNIEVDSSCDVDSIKHSGIIKKIDEGIIYVSIVAQSSCNACHAKGVCHVSEMQEEIVEIPRVGKMDRKVGDRVDVVMKKSLGTRAVMLGYFVPFLLVLFTLVVSLSVMENQGVAGLLAIGVLLPYYLFLYASKDRLRRTFTFSIQ